MIKELSAGASLSHYRIAKKIGAGGMGEVYLAHDTKLDRRVALKILPPEFAADKERMNRFVREAKSASALNHPNIITIHEIGESDGAHFIATEFIDGKTLNEYAKRDPLNFKSALEIAIQIASALDEAHSAGIVHRDIKPDNVMIRKDGIVKVLDFGLAKLSEPPAATDGLSEDATRMQFQTQAGLIMGTPKYMSPEQARGKGVDHQTDIFSFGVVLYEMLSGSSPFAGETVSDVIAAVLTREPRALSGIPSELEEIVHKTLQKDKQNRYQSAKDLLHDLREVKQELEHQSRLERTSAPNAQEPKTQIFKAPTTADIEARNSIAVLPFANMSADEDNEYFCDGLAEELLNALAKIEDLRVAARTSAFSFKGKNANVSEIGKALNVRTILEGSVRRSGNRLRITVQLINAADGYHLWSEKYDREVKDIFDVQDEIALAVVDALKLKLFGDEKAAVLKRHTRSAEAHEFYLRGVSYFMKWTQEFFQKAIESFDQAIAIDPRYASAYAALAEVYTEMSFFAFQRRFMPKAREAARKALELDDMLGEAHKSLGVILMYYDRDYAGAEYEFKRAIALDPGSAHIRNWYGWYLALVGRFDESLNEMKRARELDPLSDMINFGIGTVFHWSRQPTRAVEQYRRVLELNPNLQIAYSFLAEAYVEGGDFVSAVATIENAPIALNDPVTLSAAAHAYAKAGDRHKALEILREFERRSSPDYELAFQIAQIYVGLGDNERSLEWLDKACDEQSVWLVWLGVDPKFDPLRSDLRFQALTQRMGLPTNKTNQTDESLEAKTVMLTSEPPLERRKESRLAISDSSFKKYLLIGLLGLIILVGGYFGYKYLSPTKQIESIAVMPFENKSGNSDSEYLSDGLAESLIYRLSQLPNLKVSPTSSVFRYKGKETDAIKIGNELGVQAVMSGRMVQRGDNLTISVELVDVRNNKLLWGEQYERKMSELLATQREIAAEITNKLRLKLSGEGEQKLAKKYTDNNEAYQLYLKGRFYWNKRDEENLRKAIEQFKAAADKDPNFALAFVGLADSHAVLLYFARTSEKGLISRAKASATRALEIDDSLAEAHASLGLINRYSWNWAEGEKELKRAIELNPNYATARHWYSRHLRTLGRYTEALAQIKQAHEADPLSLVISSNLAESLLEHNDLNSAIEQCRLVIELDPNFWVAYQALAFANLKLGRKDEALTQIQKAVELLNRASVSLKSLGYVQAMAGKRNEALAVVRELEERYAKQQADGRDIAVVYAGLGEKDQVFAWLEKDFQAHGSSLADIRLESAFAPLRDDPRYKDLLKRMGLPE